MKQTLLLFFISTKLIIIVFLGYILTGCTLKQTGKKEIDITVNTIKPLLVTDLNASKELKGAEELGGSFYSCAITINNNTDSTLQFWTMSCSWNINWISNKNNFSLLILNCDANAPIKVVIKPNQRFTYYGTIHFNTPTSIDKEEQKIGLSIVTHEEEISDYLGASKTFYLEHKKKKDIIWSKPFHIKK